MTVSGAIGPARFRLLTPSPPVAAAIACIELNGPIEHVFARAGLAPVGVGEARRRVWAGVDDLVIAVTDPGRALLFPHAGSAVLSRVFAALEHLGARPHEPEALADEPHARLHAALSRVASPMGLDLLLDQPRRWSAARGPDDWLPPSQSRLLDRLVDPPLVVALGAPNIGKSSLLNALAGRDAALVADMPGTTRDHVGVTLELAGLVVRYADLPGVHSRDGVMMPPDDAIDAAAHRAAMEVVRRADLVLRCCDAGHAPPRSAGDQTTLVVALRADLGEPPLMVDPEDRVDVITSVRESRGLTELAARVRDALVPPDLLSDPRAWRLGPPIGG